MFLRAFCGKIKTVFAQNKESQETNPEDYRVFSCLSVTSVVDHWSSAQYLITVSDRITFKLHKLFIRLQKLKLHDLLCASEFGARIYLTLQYCAVENFFNTSHVFVVCYYI